MILMINQQKKKNKQKRKKEKNKDTVKRAMVVGYEAWGAGRE